MIWGLIIFGAVLAAPLVIQVTRKRRTDDTHDRAPGEFADLSQGRTHYRWSGAEHDGVCLCIHGLTTPSFVWEGVLPELSRMGFRTLTYDLYGRGYSDHVVGRQDADFFMRQINDLLDHQKIDGDITVIGYSMGGSIATEFAARHPSRVNRVVLLAPAGMSDIGTPLMRFMIRTPVVGTWLMLLLYPSLLRRGLRAEADLPGSVPGINAMQAAELQWRGFIPAVLSSQRHMLASKLETAHQSLNREKIPVLSVWGAEDTVIPVSAADVLATWNPDVEAYIIPGAGHGLTYTHTAQVTAEIEPFLIRDR